MQLPLGLLYSMFQSSLSGISVNTWLLILSVCFALLIASCGAPPDKAPQASSHAISKKAAEPRKPVRIKHLSGEVLAVNAKTKTITMLSRDKEIDLSFDDKTVVKLDLEAVNPADIPLGIRATIKYVDKKGELVAQGIFISTETADTKYPLSYSFHHQAA